MVIVALTVVAVDDELYTLRETDECSLLAGKSAKLSW